MWCKPLILAFRRQRQAELYVFQVSLDYKVRTCLKTTVTSKKTQTTATKQNRKPQADQALWKRAYLPRPIKAGSSFPTVLKERKTEKAGGTLYSLVIGHLLGIFTLKYSRLSVT